MTQHTAIEVKPKERKASLHSEKDHEVAGEVPTVETPEETTMHGIKYIFEGALKLRK